MINKDLTFTKFNEFKQNNNFLFKEMIETGFTLINNNTKHITTYSTIEWNIAWGIVWLLGVLFGAVLF